MKKRCREDEIFALTLLRSISLTNRGGKEGLMILKKLRLLILCLLSIQVKIAAMTSPLSISSIDQNDSDEPDPSSPLAGFFRPDHDPPLLNPHSLILNLYSLLPLD